MSAGAAGALAWAGCSNVRDLGGLPLAGGGVTESGVVVRADNVRNLTAEGRDALARYGVRRVVDLRWPEELAEDPVGDLPVEVVHVPVFGDHRPATRYARYATLAAAVPDAAEFARRLYGEYLEEFPQGFVAAVDAVASAPGTAVLHCTAGKDRTGIVVALILRMAGVGIEAVAADYALTDASVLLRRGLADGMSEEEVRARTFLLGAPHEGMVRFLGDVDARYGSAAGYLERAGLDGAAARALAQRLAPSA
jgi:protein-tyrosine phosphatase